MPTMPAKTRPGQTYPGGKSMRKALARLHRRIDGEQDGKRPDRILDKGDKTPWGNYGLTKPGSMKKH